MAGIHLDGLMQLLWEIFPIHPHPALEEAKTALKQFKTTEIIVLRDPLPEWSQGDIISELPFPNFLENGELGHFSAPGMIITSTCDLDRKDQIVSAPCFSDKDLKKLNNYKDICENKVFNFFFIGSALDGSEWAVDLNRLVHFRRDRVFKNLEESKISRAHSLTQIGWYLFITKFSMNYFRRDDPDTMKKR